MSEENGVVPPEEKGEEEEQHKEEGDQIPATETGVTHVDSADEKPSSPVEAAADVTEASKDNGEGGPGEESANVAEDVPVEETQVVSESEPVANEEQADEAKPSSPVADQTEGSPAKEPEKSPSPAAQEETPSSPRGSQSGSKPATPQPEAATPQAPSSKPPTPQGEQQDKDAVADSGSKAATPQAQDAPGSKPATPQTKEGTPGSKPATPGQASDSKPATPGQPSDSKPDTPNQSVDAKPATPAEQSSSKPATPADASGSKPSSPAQPPLGTAEGILPTGVGSKPGTPAKTSASSRPGTQPSAPPPPAPPPIGPEAAAAKDANKESSHSSVTLNMSWSFGMNKNVPVLNLTDDMRRAIMYVCANAGVIYDFVQNTQIILQGHSNDIKCTCASADKRWVATADVGPDNMVIVWDSYTGVPVRTMFEPYPESGVAAIAMTPDAKYLATVSAAEKQVLSIWDWTVEGESPICSATLDPKYGAQHYILFNPEDPNQLVTNSDHQVIFYRWEESGTLELRAPPLTDDDFNKPVGRYSQSVFQCGTSRALTATSIGNLVVWDTVRPAYSKDGKKSPMLERKALKLVKLQDRGINVLTTTDQFIVAGDVNGQVKFFDQTLKLMNWYQDLNLGPINALSFAHWPEFTSELQNTADYPHDATIRARQFVIRDFVIGTTPAVYAHVTTDGTNVEVIHRDNDAAVHGLSAHPSRPHIVIGSYSGLLKVWDYQSKEVLQSRWFDKGLMIRCCTYDQTGNYIAVGFTNGSLRVVDALSLTDHLSEPFRYSRDAITHVAFSHDDKYLATADAEYTVSVFKAQAQGEPWVYLGRNRAHYKLIQDLCFGVHLDSNAPRLLSLGEDRVLVEYSFDGNMPMKVEDLEVEYDLDNSNFDDLRVASSDRIEQSAIPQCMAWYPPVTAEFFIVTANDQFKFKLYNTTTKMCRNTFLGPTYGSPVQRIVILPTENAAKDKRYLAYVTSDKIGIHKLPLDGNPHNAMALIAHPKGVANLVSSFDGKHLFTAGGLDCTVHMWDINVQALEAQSKLGGDGLQPFYGLLEGGRDGELYRELEDYFYYAQIRSQGVDTTEKRRVSTHILLSEIPFVMRAMGFYPSEQETEDMLNEVRYSRYVETGQYMTEIELGDFIKLYINHRPAFGLQPDKIEWAFKVLGFDTNEGPSIDRGDLLDLLQSKGEHMTEEEVAEYLTTLLGFNEEGGSSETGRFDPSSAGDILEENLPQEISSELFANELLGFSMYNGQELAEMQERQPAA